MGFKKVAGRYAAAMFQVARSEKALEASVKDFTLIGETCAASKPLVDALRNPIVPLSRKWAVVEKLFGPRISKLALKFLKFASDKERLGILPELSEAFLLLERAHRGVSDALLVTARPLPPDTIDRLRAGLEAKHQRKFLIETREDRTLIGGFRLHLGDRVVDCSISHKLDTLEAAFVGA